MLEVNDFVVVEVVVVVVMVYLYERVCLRASFFLYASL